ncbi:hypothetical protein C0993_009175, partial [Termitomyces sp. T159_Od127]
GGGEVSFNLKSLTQRLPELGDEEEATVGYNVVWESTLREYVFEEEFGSLWGVVSGAVEDEDGLLGEAAYDNEDGVKALQLRELDNVVY